MKPVASYAVDKVRIAFYQLDGSLAGGNFQNPQAAHKQASRRIAKAAGENDLAFVCGQVLEMCGLVGLADLLHLFGVFKDRYPAHLVP